MTQPLDEQSAALRRGHLIADELDSLIFGYEYEQAINNILAQEELNHEIKVAIEKGEEAAA